MRRVSCFGSEHFRRSEKVEVRVGKLGEKTSKEKDGHDGEKGGR